MIDVVAEAELPSTTLPVFGNPEMRVATSSELDSETPHEIPMSRLRVEISRPGSLQSLVSEESYELPQHAAGDIDALFDRFVKPQLATLERYPDRDAARASAAAMLIALGKSQQALELLDARRGSADYWIEHYRAIACARLGRTDDAITLLRELASTRPADVRPLHAQARLLIKKNDWESAWAVLVAAMELSNVSTLVFSDAGAVAMARRDHAKAIQLLRKALTIDSRNAIALNNLGVCYRARGDDRNARKYFVEAHRTDPRCSPAIHNLAECYISQGRFDAAIELLEGHLARTPNDFHAQERLAWSQYKLGRLIPAIRLMTGLVANATNRGPVLNNLALFYGARSEWSRAFDLFEQAIAADSSNIGIRCNFAQLLGATGKWRRVPHVLEPAIVRGDVRGIDLLSHALTFSDRFEEAATLLRENEDCFVLSPGLPALFGFVLAARLDRPEEAATVLAKALGQHPDHPGVTNNLAYAWIKMNMLSEARELLAPWILDERVPSNDHGACLLASWGLLLLREGAYDEGVAFYRRARAQATPVLRERIKQKMLVEEGYKLLVDGDKRRGLSKLREAIHMATDAEFTKEARALITGSAGAN